MAIDLFRWGNTDPIYFKLTLNGVGVSVLLQDADIKLYKDGVFTANVGTPTTYTTNIGGGLYKLVLSGAQTQCKTIILNIKDVTSPKAFDENCLIITTGGDAAAGLDGA